MKNIITLKYQRSNADKKKKMFNKRLPYKNETVFKNSKVIMT